MVPSVGAWGEKIGRQVPSRVQLNLMMSYSAHFATQWPSDEQVEAHRAAAVVLYSGEDIVIPKEFLNGFHILNTKIAVMGEVIRQASSLRVRDDVMLWNVRQNLVFAQMVRQS